MVRSGNGIFSSRSCWEMVDDSKWHWLMRCAPHATTTHRQTATHMCASKCSRMSVPTHMRLWMVSFVFRHDTLQLQLDSNLNVATNSKFHASACTQTHISCEVDGFLSHKLPILVQTTHTPQWTQDTISFIQWCDQLHVVIFMDSRRAEISSKAHCNLSEAWIRWVTHVEWSLAE